jgi:hypothetical protein
MAIYRQLSREAAEKGETVSTGKLSAVALLSDSTANKTIHQLPPYDAPGACFGAPDAKEAGRTFGTPRVQDASVSLQGASIGTQLASVGTPEVQVPSVVTQAASVGTPELQVPSVTSTGAPKA